MNSITSGSNEMNEIGMGTTRTSVRKLVRDGYIIKKPQKNS